jgi:hypothetical protein
MPIVWEPLVAALTLIPVAGAAGGATPLAVFVTGSGGAAFVDAVDADVSHVCVVVLDVVDGVVPPLPLEEPAALVVVAPVVCVVSGDVVAHAPPGLESVVPLTVVDVVVWEPFVELVDVSSVPLVPVLLVTVLFGAVEFVTVGLIVFEPPVVLTTVCVWSPLWPLGCTCEVSGGADDVTSVDDDTFDVVRLVVLVVVDPMLVATDSRPEAELVVVIGVVESSNC